MEVSVIFLDDLKPTCPDLVQWLRAHRLVELLIMPPAGLQLYHRLRRVARRLALSDPNHSNDRAFFKLIESWKFPTIEDSILWVWDPRSTSIARHLFYTRGGAYSHGPIDR